MSVLKVLFLASKDLAESDAKEFRTTLCLLLLTLTAAVYWQLAWHESLTYDDPSFVFANSHVYTGLNVANIKWAFTTLNGGTSYWHPLTWLSLQADAQLFGQSAGGYHLTNLWFHLANTALLFLLLDNMTGKTWRSFVVAGLFALHPLHIETVAWISERKSLVCSFFWLLTMWAYAWYARGPGLLKYCVVLLSFVASLMSKPMAVTLPFALLLLDFWPLRRLRAFEPGGRDTRLKALLGEQRYADYQRSLDPDYQSLLRIADRYNLPSDVAAQVFALKQEAQSQKQQFLQNAQFDDTQRADWLQQLRQQTSTEVTALLGDKGFAVYHDRGGAWIDGLAK